MQLSPFVWHPVAPLYLGYRNCLLRAVLNAGQAIDTFRHIYWIGFLALQFEHGLRTNVDACAASVALALVNCNHVHCARFLPVAYAFAHPALVHCR